MLNYVLRSAFVFLLTTASLRDAFAATVGISYFEAGNNCSTASSSTETDPVGTCNKEPLADGSTSATLNDTTDSILFKVYTSDTCSGDPVKTQTCKCGDCCPFEMDDTDIDSDDFKLDCSKAREAATEQVTIKYYIDAQCQTILTTETDQVGVCTKEATAEEWSIATLSGDTVSFAMYSDAACTMEVGAKNSCGCSNTCCNFDSGEGYYTVVCPSASSMSAAGVASHLHGFTAVLIGAFFMVVSSRWF